MMTGSSERQRSSFLRNSRTPFSRLLAGFFSPPKVTPLEGFLLRVFFAVVVAYTFRFEVPFSTQPHPTGLAHFFDLTWLSNPASYSIFRGVIYFLLFLYAAGVLLPITLPLLALGHVLAFTLYNSQGYTHHGFQIVSLTLGCPSRHSSLRHVLPRRSIASSRCASQFVAPLAEPSRRRGNLSDLGLLKADQLSGSVALELELHRHRLDQIAPAALLRLSRSELCRGSCRSNVAAGKSLDGPGAVWDGLRSWRRSRFLLLPTGRLLS